MAEGKVRFEYHHLAFLGPESLVAAEASEFAAEQGAFWPYHDILFANQAGENQGVFNPDRLKAFAAELGLDTSAFNACLDSGRYRQKIQSDNQAARDRGVTTTPTIFINGQKIEGALPFAQFQAIIEAELARPR